MRLADEQRDANRSTLDCFDEYAWHRRRTTELVVAEVPVNSGKRACVLGAGNCYDVDLAKLAEHFSEIHLVDIDPEALGGARARQTPEIASRLMLHAPVDLTGFLDRLEEWKQMQVTEQEMLAHPSVAAKALAARLGAFDVVASTCAITQMQLSVLRALGDEHRLFDAVRHTLALTHLHTLFELTKPGGRALLVTDVLSNQNYHYLDRLPADADCLRTLSDVVTADNVIYTARPGLFHVLARQDAILRKAEFTPPLAAWIWQNGPESRFLVYAMELRRRAEAVAG